MKGHIVLLIFFISIGTAVVQDEPRFRLHHNAIPKSYDIRIQPFMDNNSFYGEVNIYVELQNSLRYLSLNLRELEIKTLVLDNSNQTAYQLEEKYELVHIHHKDGSYIDPGEHLVHVEYMGKMRLESIGLFKNVIELKGRKYVSAATMFSPPYARMVFPSFDEPAFKSRFNIRLVSPDSSFTALSNMEAIGSYKIRDGIAVDFKTTPKISPYLVCFVFTQHNYKSAEYLSRDGRVIPLRFFLVDEYLDQATFLLDVAKHALQFFEEYTNMTYPGSKLDFIEVPYFINLGMENLGLVVLTHNGASYNASSEIPKVEHMRIASKLIVHEIAHMWFGDIMTPMWYNDLWLAEGFAALMEVKGLDNQYPLWQLVEMEAVLSHEDEFYNDITPIINFANTNDQVEAQFGEITYLKGSALLSMLEVVMGQENFKQGVRKFLRNFFMDSATTGDFISTMQSVTPFINLRGFLLTWLHQDRFPLVIVSRDKLSNGYILHQRSMVVTPNTTSIFRRKWTIPVTFISSCNRSSTLVWFDRDADELLLASCGEKWIKFNPNSTSFYRVLYTEEQYEQLLDHFDDLSEVDQAHLILESAHHVADNAIPCNIPLKFIGKLRKKEGLLPSLASFKAMKNMMRRFGRNQTIFEKLRKFFIDTFTALYEKLKWRVSPEDDHVQRLLRAKLIEAMCLSPITYEKCATDAAAEKAESVELHEDVLNVWNRMLNLNKSPQKYNVTDEKSLVKNSTTDPVVSNSSKELYMEQCMSWIKINL